MLYEYQPDYPRRVVDWRWQLAQELVDTGARHRNLMDAGSAAAWRYARALAAEDGSKESRMRTMLSHRAAHYAYDISKSKQSNLYIADEIEAQLCRWDGWLPDRASLRRSGDRPSSAVEASRVDRCLPGNATSYWRLRRANEVPPGIALMSH